MGVRPGTKMEIRQVLCLPPASAPTSGANKIPNREHLADPYGTTLAEETMVLYSKRTCCRTPLDTTNPGGSPLPGPSVMFPSRKVEPRCLVSEEKLLKARGFSNRLINTLLTSRKTETRTIYKKKYGNSSTIGVQEIPLRQSSVAVLEFLQCREDKGLSFSTLKSQVSALCLSGK